MTGLHAKGRRICDLCNTVGKCLNVDDAILEEPCERWYCKGTMRFVPDGSAKPAIWALYCLVCGSVRKYVEFVEIPHTCGECGATQGWASTWSSTDFASYFITCLECRKVWNRVEHAVCPFCGKSDRFGSSVAASRCPTQPTFTCRYCKQIYRGGFREDGTVVGPSECPAYRGPCEPDTVQPTSLRILGIPWTVETAELVEDDPNHASDVDCALCKITLAGDLAPVKYGWHLFWCILRAIDEDMTFEDARPTAEELDTVHTCLYAAVADNWGIMQNWFAEAPQVEECTLRLIGLPVSLKRPHRIPGCGGKTLGRADYKNAALYVRSDLPPFKAAVAALHEAMHFALYATCRLGTEEAYIRPVAIALAQVFFDNTDLGRIVFEWEDKPCPTG